MLPNVGMGELILILVIILLLFGAKRLPEVAKGLGRSLRSFKDGLNDINESIDERPAQKSEPTLAQNPDEKTTIKRS
jgi:sec-independent protein translocase protein TatA